MWVLTKPEILKRKEGPTEWLIGAQLHKAIQDEINNEIIRKIKDACPSQIIPPGEDQVQGFRTAGRGVFLLPVRAQEPVGHYTPGDLLKELQRRSSVLNGKHKVYVDPNK